VSIFPYAPSSLEGLAARWVQWAAATGSYRNPVIDSTGKHAHRRQPSDVWFLAGAFGGMVERRCAVPAGRPLFFPAFNIWCPHGTYIPPLPGAKGQASIDGQPLPVVTVDAGELFEVKGAFLNPVTRRRAPVQMRVWGLWARVNPPAPGPHLVEFSGTDGHQFHVSARYHLDVRA
jgi:hypothetical protein